jgi:putative transposase
MDRSQMRVDAIRRRLRGESVVSICRALGRSRRWFYYWFRRYSPSDASWCRDRSRAPRHQARKLPKDVERLICEVRTRLLRQKYAQRGAVAVQWELRRLGVHPLPGIWTINRIIHRHKLRQAVLPKLPRPNYPKIEAGRPGVAQQMDLVGPRYVAHGVRFYGLHLIDICSNAVALETVITKHYRDVCQALVAQWHRLGVPRYLQIDNELSFRGSNRHPRGFGLVVRLCLHLGIEIAFIPEGEPWRNGIVERFNDTFDKSFLRTQRFRSLAHLRRELRTFERFHNEHHRYAKLGQRTPRVVHIQEPRRGLPEHLDLSIIRKTWKDGRISFTRLTDSHGSVRFFTERFLVDPTLVHEYVVGTITTKDNRLRFYHQGKCIKTIIYKVSKGPLLSHM